MNLHSKGKCFLLGLLIILLPRHSFGQDLCLKVSSSLADLRIGQLSEELRRNLRPFFSSKTVLFDLDTTYFSASLSKNSIFIPPKLVKKIPILLINRIDSKRPGSGLYANFLNILQAIGAEAGYEGLVIYIVGNPRHHQFYLRNGFTEFRTSEFGTKLKSKDFLRLNSAAAEHSR